MIHGKIINKIAMRAFERIYNQKAEMLDISQNSAMEMGCGDEDWTHFRDDWEELEYQTAFTIGQHFKIDEEEILAQFQIWQYYGG